MYIRRTISKSIIDKIQNSGKIVVIYGARQLGKTTLSKKIIDKLNLKTLLINADQDKYVDVLSSKDLSRLKALVDGYKLLFIDEAQRIPDLGINLKILHDEIPGLKILITGSSSINIANDINETLTGRKWTYTLFPLSLQELSAEKNRFELQDALNDLLVFGAYPEVYTTVNFEQKKELLYEIVQSYLYKDILELANIKHHKKIKDLLKLLAFQIGSEVSILELSRTLGINRETVESYLNLLEQSFVIYRLSGYNRNLRKEIKKQDKFYFYDLGIRNTVIDNFSYPDIRGDLGALWENFIINERTKYLKNNLIFRGQYFWRTYTGAEIDYVEETDGKLTGYEIKLHKSKIKIPKTWAETYKNSSFYLINKKNFLDFLIE
ncbi:MAG: AAA family ATPase [Candidatus Zixiibacteriota bacterium]|nr:MAG: AAA family ATPase [candidate division Zixibacteria bacterium]